MPNIPTTKTIAMAPNGSHEGIKMWPSEAIAIWLYDVANIVLIISLVTGVIATGLIVWMGNTKEGYLKRDLAHATEHTAILEVEAGRLRIELERELEKRAPRVLTDEQKSILTSELKGKIRNVIFSVQRDAEARLFALQLEVVLQDAGAALRVIDMPPGEILYLPAGGVTMYSPRARTADIDKLAGDPLYEALKKTNLFGGAANEPFVALGPEYTKPEGERLNRDVYIVYVGQKNR